MFSLSLSRERERAGERVAESGETLINIHTYYKKIKRQINKSCHIAQTLSPTLSPTLSRGAGEGAWIVAFLLSVLLTGCSPKYDWREVHDELAPFTVLMPAKPSQLSQDIQLGQQAVTMHMMATQVDGVKFAVGAVKTANPTEAQTALITIKNTLINNMGANVTAEKSSVTHVDGKLVTNHEFDAINRKSSLRMVGRVIAHDDWAYEVIVVGREQAVDQEIIDTFIESFKPS